MQCYTEGFCALLLLARVWCTALQQVWCTALQATTSLERGWGAHQTVHCPLRAQSEGFSCQLHRPHRRRGREPPALGSRSSPRPCANQQRSPRSQPPKSPWYMHSSVLNTGRTRCGTQSGTGPASASAPALASAACAARLASRIVAKRNALGRTGGASSAAGSSARAGSGSNKSQVPAWAASMAGCKLSRQAKLTEPVGPRPAGHSMHRA